MADIRITINPINKCTMSCKYCITKESNSYKSLSIEQVETAIKEIKSLFIDEENFLTIHFNSKDVFLCWDSLIRPFIEKYSKEMKFSIHSNGILLTEDKIDFLKAHNVFILVSLDGPKEVQDINRKFRNGNSSFEIVNSKIKMLKEKGCRFNVISTFNEQSIDKVLDSYYFHMNNNYGFSFLFDNKNSQYDFNKLKLIFSKLAEDFSTRTIKEQRNFRDFYRAIKPNKENYFFAINLHGITAKINKHTFKMIAEFSENGVEIEKYNNFDKKLLVSKINHKCNINKDRCITCPAFHGNYSKKPLYDMEIYCLLLTEIFEKLNLKKEEYYEYY